MVTAEKYFVVKIQIDDVDPQTGRIKKLREEKLVNAISVTDCEAKVMEKMGNISLDWRITSVSESKIDEVFE